METSVKTRVPALKSRPGSISSLPGARDIDGTGSYDTHLTRESSFGAMSSRNSSAAIRTPSQDSGLDVTFAGSGGNWDWRNRPHRSSMPPSAIHHGSYMDQPGQMLENAEFDSIQSSHIGMAGRKSLTPETNIERNGNLVIDMENCDEPGSLQSNLTSVSVPQSAMTKQDSLETDVGDISVQQRNEGPPEQGMTTANTMPFQKGITIKKPGNGESVLRTSEGGPALYCTDGCNVTVVAGPATIYSTPDAVRGNTEESLEKSRRITHLETAYQDLKIEQLKMKNDQHMQTIELMKKMEDLQRKMENIEGSKITEKINQQTQELKSLLLESQRSAQSSLSTGTSTQQSHRNVHSNMANDQHMQHMSTRSTNQDERRSRRQCVIL